MLKNYFKIGWRNIRNNKLFSFLNIFGLSIGFSCCLLIALYIRHESSYDHHHKNADRLYEIATTFVKDAEDHPMPNTPAPMAAAMKQEFPEIDQAAWFSAEIAKQKILPGQAPFIEQLEKILSTSRPR